LSQLRNVFFGLWVNFPNACLQRHASRASATLNVNGF
jgi:hypothetical protein